MQSADNVTAVPFLSCFENFGMLPPRMLHNGMRSHFQYPENMVADKAILHVHWLHHLILT